MLLKLLKVIFLVYARILLSSDNTKEIDVRDVIRNDGYPLEIHHVTTEDGYILELHRIPNGRSSLSNQNKSDNGVKITQKPVVVLTHCLVCSSAAYVVLGPNDALAYMLADSGFDVWMINFRGTNFSRRHKRLSPNNIDFWKFSSNEMGIYDIPASLDYIFRVTKTEKLDVIGYSMGSSTLMIALSERPEYNKRVNSFTSMSPAGYVGNTKLNVASLSPSTINLLINIALKLRMWEVGRSEMKLKQFFSSICSPKFKLNFLCDLILSSAGVILNKNLDRNTVSLYFKFLPEPTSLRTMVHFYQNAHSGRFCKYDFGRYKNLKFYRSLEPPSYNLSRITTKVNMIWSLGDEAVVPENVERTLSELPNVGTKYLVPDESFSHVDFIWGTHSRTLVNKVVIDMLKKQQNN